MGKRVKYHNGIILTNDKNLSSLFEKAGLGLNLKFESTNEISDYLLNVLDKMLSLLVYDCTNLEQESLKWIKVIRKIRPKLPLIVISKEFDPKVGGELYDEGTFYYQQQPVNGDVISDVLTAALNN
jgi:DNA-binding NtrC family response regulator